MSWGVRAGTPGESILDQLKPAVRARVVTFLAQFPAFDVNNVHQVFIEDGQITAGLYVLDALGQRQAITLSMGADGAMTEVLVPYDAAAAAAKLQPKLRYVSRPYNGPIPAAI